MKNITFLSVIKYLLALAVAGFLLYWVFQQVDWEDFVEKIYTVDYRWVLFSMILSFTSYIARAYRWTLLINPFGYSLKTGRSLIAVFIGYLANLAFPRLGEVTRCAIIKKNDRIPVPLSFGTVITERIFDLIMLIILFVLTFFLEFDLLVAFFSELMTNVPDLSYVMFIVGTLLIIIIVIFLVFRKRLTSWAGRFTLYQKINGILMQLWQGLLSFRKIENKTGFIISTVVIWVVYFLMTYVITFAMSETQSLGIVAGMTMLVGAGVALILPVQGGFGTYHAIITLLLGFYGIEKETGRFFATLLHSSQIVTIIFFGGISLLISFFIKRKINDQHSTENPDRS